MNSLIGLTTQELEKVAVELDAPAFRGRQLATAIYQQKCKSIADITGLPKQFKTKLEETYVLGMPEVSHESAAGDKTVKYLMRLQDRQEVESVLLPYENRVSVCLSSQIGCAAGCTFCATGKGGFGRNLTAGEIVGQLMRMQHDSTERISHAVYMGMGEPLWNYDAVVKSLRILSTEIGMSNRNLTVSTVGVVPGIMSLADENLPITLAISLHAADDELRSSLIPTGRKWKIDEILTACEYYNRTSGRNLTFEYLMIGGVNDSVDQAKQLARLLRKYKLPGNVNLIPFNYVDTEQGFKKPERDAIKAFRETLERAGRVTTQRMTRGHSISAACGQLKRNFQTDQLIKLESLALSALMPIPT